MIFVFAFSHLPYFHTSFFNVKFILLLRKPETLEFSLNPLFSHTPTSNPSANLSSSTFKTTQEPNHFHHSAVTTLVHTVNIPCLNYYCRLITTFSLLSFCPLFPFQSLFSSAAKAVLLKCESGHIQNHPVVSYEIPVKSQSPYMATKVLHSLDLLPFSSPLPVLSLSLILGRPYSPFSVLHIHQSHICHEPSPLLYPLPGILSIVIHLTCPLTYFGLLFKYYIISEAYLK